MSRYAHLFRSVTVTIGAVVLRSVFVFGQGPPVSSGASKVPPAVTNLLANHRAWSNSPGSIQIVGTSTRGGVTGPVTITATQQEQLLIQYSNNKQVVTPTASFKDDGTKISWDPTTSGFLQLDMTSVFFLAQLPQRTLTSGTSTATPLPQGPGQKVHLTNSRSETHYGRLVVKDEFDLFIDSSGLFAGISRSFYQSDPRFRFTVAYLFSDYKDTQGVLMPYHIETYLKGSKIETITVDSYQFDVPAAPSLFAPRGK